MLSHRFLHTFGKGRGQARRVSISGPFADQARPRGLHSNCKDMGVKSNEKMRLTADAFLRENAGGLVWPATVGARK